MESRRDGENASSMNLIRAAARPQDTLTSGWEVNRAHEEREAGDASALPPGTAVDPAMTYGCVDWYLYPAHGKPQPLTRRVSGSRRAVA